jgi:hypothetical protein
MIQVLNLFDFVLHRMCFFREMVCPEYGDTDEIINLQDKELQYSLKTVSLDQWALLAL